MQKQLLSLFLIFIPLTGLADSPENKLSEAHYQISISQENPQIVHVEGQVKLANNTLKMASWGHPHLPQGWATFVQKLEVTNSANRPVNLQIKKDGWGAWSTDSKDGELLNLSYEVHLNHHQYDWNSAGGEDSRPAVHNGALFLVTKALFIYSPNLKNAIIEFNLPEDWKISSPWSRIKSKPNRYFADSWTSLVNNALVLGSHHQRSVVDENMTIALAIDNDLSDSVDLFQTVFKKQLASYRKVFDGTPKTQYLVSIRTANADDGESFENSFNQVITPGKLDERLIVWANTMGHELFHYWNGNHFLFAKEKSTVEWFGEGFTEYYASLTLFRAGLIEESLYFKKLERYLGRYFISKKMWPDTNISLVEAGKEKHKNWLLIYGGGATLAFALDIEIRSMTDGNKGLDDVMRLLKKESEVESQGLLIGDILNAVNQISGKDFSAFFDKYINNSDDYLDITEYLNKAGLEIEQTADEFYLRHNKNPTAMQRKIYHGITNH